MVRIGKATDRAGFDKTSVRDYESPAAVRERPGDVAVEFSQFSGEVGDEAIRMLTNIGRESAKAGVKIYLHVRRHGRQQFDLMVNCKSHGNAGFECARDRARVHFVKCVQFLPQPASRDRHRLERDADRASSSSSVVDAQ